MGLEISYEQAVLMVLRGQAKTEQLVLSYFDSPDHGNVKEALAEMVRDGTLKHDGTFYRRAPPLPSNTPDGSNE